MLVADFEFGQLFTPVSRRVLQRLANSIDPEQSDQGLHCLLELYCPKLQKKYDSLKIKTG